MWMGSAVLTDSCFAYVGAVGPTRLHSHHAIQIAIALDGSITLRDDRGRVASGAIAVIPQDARHAIEAATDRLLLVFLRPINSARRPCNSPPNAASTQRAFWRGRMRIISSRRRGTCSRRD